MITGGNSAVHQFARVGTGAMIGGATAISLDLMPHFTVTATNFAGSLNLVCLRWKGFSLDQIAAVRWVYKTICRDGLGLRVAVERLRERSDDPVVAMYLDFIAKSKRGIVTRHGRAGSERDRATELVGE